MFRPQNIARQRGDRGPNDEYGRDQDLNLHSTLLSPGFNSIKPIRLEE